MSVRQASTVRQHLLTVTARSLLVRGVFATALGVVMFIAPVFTVGAIGGAVVLLIGLWLLLDGIASCVLAARRRRHRMRGWGWTLAGGIAAVVSGGLVLLFPLITVAVGGLLVLWLLALGLILRGGFELGDHRLGGWGAMTGLVNLFFGLFICMMLLLNPGAALLTMVWVAAVYGILFGVLSLVLAFRIRSLRDRRAHGRRVRP